MSKLMIEVVFVFLSDALEETRARAERQSHRAIDTVTFTYMSIACE